MACWGGDSLYTVDTQINGTIVWSFSCGTKGGGEFCGLGGIGETGIV
jgi:hypothetical protein